jgi:hypothetical protein
MYEFHLLELLKYLHIRKLMKILRRFTILLLLLGLLLSACDQEQSPSPTFTSTVNPPTPTILPAPTLTPTALATSTLTMNCSDEATVDSGVYRAENNTWGKGTLTGWSQCIGLKIYTDGTLMARWTWNWPNSGDNVKAYPEIIYGQKPGSMTTTADLPKKISSLSEVSISYDITSTHTGSGNIAFDIWLTDTQNPSTWGVPPITQEIMIWLDSFGGMRPGGTWIEQASIDGTSYNIYVGENFGQGWRYIAFARAKSQLGVGMLNLVSFLSYIQAKSLATGDEYIASIELGNEVVSGVGETNLKKYVIYVR